MKCFTVVSSSALETRRLGKRLGRLLKGGEIIGLNGELGSGKTCFVRGMAEGLEVEKEAWIRSPSFTLINEYQGRVPVYHIDLYRVGSREEMEGLNLREYLFSEGVSLVEWFEHLPVDEVDEYLELKLAHGGGNKRRLAFSAQGQRYERIVERLGVIRVKRSKVQKFKRRPSPVC